MAQSTIFATYRARFEADLARYGFIAEADGRWRGTVDTSWYAADGTSIQLEEEILIEVRTGFPFDKPRVLPCTTDPLVMDSLHREPGGGACLWRDDATGWHPGIAVVELLDRTREWFTRCRESRWRDNERPADLHLYYPSDRMRTMVAMGDDWLPAKDASMGRFGVWQTNDQIAFVGDPQSGAGTPGPKNKNPVLKQLLVGNERVAEVGVWFRIEQEPKRIATAADLVAMIDAVAARTGAAVEHMTGVLGTKIRGMKRLYIALGYRDGGSDEHWLFLQCDVGSRDGKRWATPAALKTLSLNACITAPAEKRALLRRVGDSAEAVVAKHVIVFGIGAIGSEVALLLAKTGVGKLSLVDNDRLTPTNAIRHAAGLRYAGLLKTLAIEQEILNHAPYCTVEQHLETWKPDELAKLVGAADLVIDATARPTFSALLNEIALAAETPVLYVAAHRRASIGRVRQVRPHRDACLTCYEAGYMNDATYPTIPPMDEGSFIEEGCGTPTITAGAIDLQITANAAARIAVDHLSGSDAPENHTLVVLQRVPGAVYPFDNSGIHTATYAPKLDCESCGT